MQAEGGSAGPGPASQRIAALARCLLAAQAARLWLAPAAAVVAEAAAAGSAWTEPGWDEPGWDDPGWNEPGWDDPAWDELCRRCAASGQPLVVPGSGASETIEFATGSSGDAVGDLFVGVPCTDSAGVVIAVLYVLNPAVHPPTAATVELLQQLAAFAVAELQLLVRHRESELSRERAELVIDAAGIGTFDWDLLNGRLVWDERLIEIFGYDRAEFDDHIDRFTERLHPDDEQRVRQEYDQAIESLGRYDAEFRVVLPSGQLRWVQAQGRVFADQSGAPARLLGAALDITEARTGQANLARVLEAVSSPFISMDLDWRLTYVNAETERLIGLERRELLGSVLWDVLPSARRSEFEGAYREAVASGQPALLEMHYPGRANLWFEVRISPSLDGITLYFVQVTDRRAAQELVQLSAQVGEYLAGSLNLDDAVLGLARLLVPRLADWCIVSVVDSDGALHDLTSWHHDRALRPVTERFAAARLGQLGDMGLVLEALRNDEPNIVVSGATDLGLQILTDPVAIECLRELAPESAVVLPLTAHRRVAGMLTLCRGAERDPMSQQELTAALSIARRAGMALENARLYADQRTTAQRLDQANRRLQQVAAHDRTVARALQDAMLTRLPEPDHLHIISRYLSANETDQVGGDWYDAVVLPTGATILIIGDVVGHDINAAALMGQLRNMLRAFAWDHAEPPSAILSRLDRALPELGIDALATVVVALVEQTDADRAAGMRTLRWSNAGHPAPALLHADGFAEILDDSTDLLLGINPGTHRRDYTCPLPPDCTLLLYTDGLIETRTQDLDSGQRRLLAALSEHDQLAPEDLLDAVLSDLVGTQPDDDVALLAVRFYPEDKPRPIDAGPEHL